MTDANTHTRDPDEIAGQVQEVAEARKQLVEQRSKDLVTQRETGITPFHVTQSTFPETMKQGVPGMINRMVDYNVVTRSVEGPAGGMPAARAVSQSTAYDINCALGGTVVAFVGITVLDPTNIHPVGSAVPLDAYAQYTNCGVLTKGEIFATATVITAAGDPVHFGAADGILTNTGGIGPVVGARWKYSQAGQRTQRRAVGYPALIPSHPTTIPSSTPSRRRR